MKKIEIKSDNIGSPVCFNSIKYIDSNNEKIKMKKQFDKEVRLKLQSEKRTALKELFKTEKERVEKLIQFYSCYRTGVNNYKTAHYRDLLKRCENKRKITVSLVSELQKCV